MMKTLAKVFTIIGIVCNFWTIIAPIIGFICLGKMKRGEKSVGLAVCNLIFCSLLGGIFQLLDKE